VRCLLTHCLEGGFRQGVSLGMSRSEAVHVARGRPLVTAVFRPFWHGCGTEAGVPQRVGSQFRRPHPYVANLCRSPGLDVAAASVTAKVIPLSHAADRCRLGSSATAETGDRLALRAVGWA
jgi:hypothetical protein